MGSLAFSYSRTEESQTYLASFLVITWANIVSSSCYKKDTLITVKFQFSYKNSFSAYLRSVKYIKLLSCLFTKNASFS
jgi:hypothetical protein